MEPINIKVNVEVGLKQATIEALSGLFNPLRGCTTCATEIESAPQPDPQPKRKEKKSEPAPEPQPQPQGEDPEGTGAEDIDDLPPDDAPAPKKATPTEDDARQAVKAARDRGVPAKTIKALMKDSFDIASSVECPAERRQELIDELNKLAA